jgi:hypothetical protein
MIVIGAATETHMMAGSCSPNAAHSEMSGRDERTVAARNRHKPTP